MQHRIRSKGIQFQIIINNVFEIKKIIRNYNRIEVNWATDKATVPLEKEKQKSKLSSETRNIEFMEGSASAIEF